MNTLTGYLRQAGTALRFLLFATLVLGVAYPLAVFGAGQLIAPYQANGSIIKDPAGRPGRVGPDRPGHGRRFRRPGPPLVPRPALGREVGPGVVLGVQPRVPTTRNCSTRSPPTGPPSPRLKAWMRQRFRPTP